MAPRRTLTGLKASFIDLLLGALGGVALLVILYFAMQSANAQKSASFPQNHLVVEIDNAPDGWAVGRDVWLLIENEDMERCYLAPGTHTVSGTLKVSWQSTPATAGMKYFAAVTSDPDDTLKLSAWVRQLKSAQALDVADFVQALAAWLESGEDLRLVVYWLKTPDTKHSIVLSASNGFSAEVEVSR